MRTGPIVTLEVAKQGAIYHGLATLLSQPSPVMTRGTYIFVQVAFLWEYAIDRDSFVNISILIDIRVIANRAKDPTPPTFLRVQ